MKKMSVKKWIGFGAGLGAIVSGTLFPEAAGGAITAVFQALASVFGG